MEGHCSTGQSPQWAVVPMGEEEESLKIEVESKVPHLEHRLNDAEIWTVRKVDVKSV
jgi:hypothetical protein